MVAGSLSVEIESPVEAKRLWNALVMDGDNLLLKQAPHIFSSVTILQGDGGAGTIKQLNLTSANKDSSYVKVRVDEIDEEKLVFIYSYVEGGLVGKKLASVKHETKYTPKAEGGCLWTATYQYDTLPGISPTDLKIQEMRDGSAAMFKKTEAYLLANPTLYC